MANCSSFFSHFREVGGWEPKISHREPKHSTFSSESWGPAGPYLWELFPAKAGPACCNKFLDEILEGRSPSCRLAHLSGPMLVVRLPGPLHLCRRPSHQVGGGAGAVVS